MILLVIAEYQQQQAPYNSHIEWMCEHYNQQWQRQKNGPEKSAQDIKLKPKIQLN